jgi:hypothetical protein
MKFVPGRTYGCPQEVSMRMKSELIALACVLGALLACKKGSRGESASTEPTVVTSSAPKAGATEIVRLKNKEWEVGEGSNRDGRGTLWPADGSPLVELPYGTRIELLEHLPGHTRPPGLTPGYSSSRVRVKDGEHADLVGYVRAFQIQATSAANERSP